MSETGYDVFISYASADVAFAEEAYRRLSAAGFRVWFDQARLVPGYDWYREIESGCESSRVVLPVLTPRWKLSEWTKFETYGAEAVIPLLVEGTQKETFTPPLTRFQTQAVGLATTGANVDDAAWSRLMESIRKLLAQPPPNKLARLADVRYRASRYFVGREKELNTIHEELHQSPTASLTQGRVRAIAGMGGVGKTTLARQYIEKFWRCYPQVFWVDCRLGVENEFARLCDLLLPQHRAEADVPEKARFALRSLENADVRLLVLDNAENESEIQRWIPKSGFCRTLITSRFAGWSAAVNSSHLYVLDADPAQALLATRSGRKTFAALSSKEQSACALLAQKLGYLPLALEQAAAYIEQQGEGFEFTDYLRLYEAASESLLAEHELGSTEYPDPVITTWKTTTGKLAPAARGILRLCSYVSTAQLPVSVLIDGVEFLREETAAVAGESALEVREAELWVRRQIKQLRAYSMVEGDGQSIALHPLVQTVERIRLAEASESQLATLRRSLEWINAAFDADPSDVRSWSTLLTLVPHALIVAEYAERANIDSPTSELLIELGILFYERAQYAVAEPLYRRALTLLEQTCGTDAPNVATVLNLLASLLTDMNRLTEAEPLYRRALAIDERAYGGEHPEVATVLLNLAVMLHTAGRQDEAEQLYRRVLAIFGQLDGGAKSQKVINNLAVLLSETNRQTEAEMLYRRAVAAAEQAYGVEHPEVAVSLDNLASLLKETNRGEEAEPLYRRALSIHEQAYGADHPKVAHELNNLAVLYAETDRLEEAETLLRRALAINEQTYGTDHPNVATILSNQVLLLQKSNRPAEAEVLSRRVVNIFEQSYGAEHPHTAMAIHNYASLQVDLNHFFEAKRLTRHALTILENFQRRTGHEHQLYLQVKRSHRKVLLLISTTIGILSILVCSSVVAVSSLIAFVVWLVWSWLH